MFLLSIPAEPVSSSKQAERLDNYILGIAKGDKEALAGLYESTHTAVYGFALSLCKNVPDAEDVLQDVFVQIWNAAEQYTPAGKPMAWIFTITRNLALLCLRQKNKMIPFSAEDLQEHLEEISQVTSDDRIVLEALLKSLQDTERQILVLHALSGMKHREIASLLQIPLPTVLSKYHRAVKKLGKIMKEADIE
ncbi:MAG: RNA polymerase sigma factor [Clostridiales bacterium]|jgi:RNA polymerase sigma factor, sigma-70 family|nr:RNA polymerase sigma factor [Clostridiales bacterium]